MHLSKKNWAWQLIAISLLLMPGIFLRLYGVFDHGFHDGDEYAKHLFFTTDWYRRVLNDGVSGSFWARPSAHLLNIFLGNWLGFSPELYAIKTAFFSISLLIIGFVIAQQLFGWRAAIVSAAFLGGSMTVLYWSHTTKEIIPSTFFFLLALYFLLRIVDRYEKSQDIKLRHATSFGFLIGLAFTFHPNLALTVVATGVVFGVTLIRFAVVSLKRACLAGLAALTASIILIVGYEIFFLYIIKSPIWAGEKDIGYLKYIFYHSDLRSKIEPSVGFYAGILNVEKPLAALLVFLSLAIGFILKTEKRAVILSLAFIITFVVLGYATSNAWPAYRNIAHLLVPSYLLVGAVVASWLTRLHVTENVRFTIVILLSCMAYYPAFSQLERNNSLWSAAEHIHWHAGGGENSAIFRPRQSVYHWYGYYFPYSLVDNMNQLWEKFLCQDVEYLVIPDLSQTPDLAGLPRASVQKVLSSDDKFQPWASGYIKLHNSFDLYQDMHNFKLLFDKKEPLQSAKSEFLTTKNGFKPYEAEFIVAEPAQWMTVTGNLKPFGGLGSEGVAVIGVGSRKEPFKYGYRVIEPDVLSENQRAQLIANNKAGFFKIGFARPFSFDNDPIVVRVFLQGTDNTPLNQKPASINLRQYAALGDLPSSCQLPTLTSAGENDRLSQLVNGSFQKKLPITKKLQADANAIHADWLEPGAKYRLKLRFKLGDRTVGRVEVVSKGKLIAKKLYFKPSADHESFDFQIPYDLGEHLYIYISAARGSNIEYSDITIRKKR